MSAAAEIPVTEQLLEDRSLVKGVIYCITHTESGKKYVGQTVTHRLNKGKYRPYGIRRRFAEHLSNVHCNTKANQSACLYNAIRAHGPDAFTIRELEQCEIGLMDDRERFHISNEGSLFPSGYNLTTGGAKTFTVVANVVKPPLNPAGKRGGCTHRSPEVRARMSASTKAVFSTDTMRKKISSNTTAQHDKTKRARFAGVIIDQTNLDQYLTVQTALVIVRAGGQEARFSGKHETIEQLVARAKDFLKSLETPSPAPSESEE